MSLTLHSSPKHRVTCCRNAGRSPHSSKRVPWCPTGRDDRSGWPNYRTSQRQPPGPRSSIYVPTPAAAAVVLCSGQSTSVFPQYGTRSGFRGDQGSGNPLHGIQRHSATPPALAACLTGHDGGTRQVLRAGRNWQTGMIMGFSFTCCATHYGMVLWKCVMHCRGGAVWCRPGVGSWVLEQEPLLKAPGREIRLYIIPSTPLDAAKPS